MMTSPLVAFKTLMVKAWEQTCEKCGGLFDAEESTARIAPDVPLVVDPSEPAFSVLRRDCTANCPHCGAAAVLTLGDSKNKKIQASLLIHPEWLAGSPSTDSDGQVFGGAARDDATSTARWNHQRAKRIQLIEVRGPLSETLLIPGSTVPVKIGKGGGTAKPGVFTCAACGTTQETVEAIRVTGSTAPFAAYAIQGYAPSNEETSVYGGKFYAPFNDRFAQQFSAAAREWEQSKDRELSDFWPKSDIPDGLRATVKDVITGGHGYRAWTDMFNSRQLLVHARLLRAIIEVGNYPWQVREYVLGAFQQYLRGQCMFSFWHITKDHYAPALSNNDFRPKMTVVEVGVFSPVGYGNWSSAVRPILEGAEWALNPWELVPATNLGREDSGIASRITGKSEKVYPGDPVRPAHIAQGSSTDLSHLGERSLDIVITDPPFGGLVQYSELADFFYVWLRLVLKAHYPGIFSNDYSPKTMEAVANRFREPADPEGFYQRILTQCWQEAGKALKTTGILAFTFHHSEDEPWIAVLESLFDAGFYLEATYPIRSDETKGDNAEFGAQKIEYDIIHVCRKRTEEPTPVSWGRMRREVLADVRRLQALLQNHADSGLPAADLQVIRRGKALEYFSRHYGKVYVDEERSISVKEALVGINQLIDEDTSGAQDPPPVTAEPLTRQFLRITLGTTEIARDQMQKFLRGSGIAPEEFVLRGWCTEHDKMFSLVDPLAFANEWHGRQKRKLTYDYDQAMVIMGASCPNSGINVTDTLNNPNFRPHPALGRLLKWHTAHGATQRVRDAAAIAVQLHTDWESQHLDVTQQLKLFFGDGEEG